MPQYLTGGVFTDFDGEVLYELRRDKDTPSQVIDVDKSIGIIGSDTFNELDDDIQSRVNFEKVAGTVMRFALAAPKEKYSDIKAKLRLGETLSVATSYPRAAKNMVGLLGSPLRIVTTPGGSVESLPKSRKDVEAVIDIVDSGDTIRENGLEIIVDNLDAVSLGVVWKNSIFAVPENMATEETSRKAFIGAINSIELKVAQALLGKLDSYTQRLAANENKLVKKIGEENGELIRALLKGSSQELDGEIADALYVLAIAAATRGTSLRVALGILAARNLNQKAQTI